MSITPNFTASLGVSFDEDGPPRRGEIFRVLKEKEEEQNGEYRTRRLVLEAWDRLEAK